MTGRYGVGQKAAYLHPIESCRQRHTPTNQLKYPALYRGTMAFSSPETSLESLTESRIGRNHLSTFTVSCERIGPTLRLERVRPNRYEPGVHAYPKGLDQPPCLLIPASTSSHKQHQQI